MFVRDGAMTPGPSRKCDITFFVKGRPKSAQQSRDSTVAARSVQSVTDGTVIPGVTRMSFPRVKVPPFKNARFSSSFHPRTLESRQSIAKSCQSCDRQKLCPGRKLKLGHLKMPAHVLQAPVQLCRLQSQSGLDDPHPQTPLTPTRF